MQIKSKKRVSEFGEVFTAQKQVSDMVDLISDTVSELSSTVFEPACGTGNFLVEILKRKLSLINYTVPIEMQLLLAVSSMYGVDIQNDNVEECRQRIMIIILSLKPYWTQSFKNTLSIILKHNIICGDTLMMSDRKGNPIVIPEWIIRDNGTLIRKDVLLSDMINNNGESTAYTRKQYYRWDDSYLASA